MGEELRASPADHEHERVRLLEEFRVLQSLTRPLAQTRDWLRLDWMTGM